MKSVVGALRVNLGLDSAQFSKGLKDAATGLRRAGQQMQVVGKSLTKNLTAPIAGATAAVVASLGVMSKNLGDLSDQARLSGVGVEEFQKLAFAAKTVGIEQQKLSDILKDTNDKFGDFMATGGGPLKDFFENIAPKVGITADAFRDLSSADALQLYISSLEKAGVSQQDMTFYLEALASDATGLVPIFAKNGEELGRLSEQAERFGIASEKTVGSARSFNESLDGLKTAVAGLGLALVESGVLEKLAEIVAGVAVWVSKLQEVNPDIVEFGALFAVLAASIGPVLIALGLAATAVAAIGAPVAAAVVGIAALTAAALAFWPEIERAATAVQQFIADVVYYLSGLPNQIAASFAALPAMMVQIGRDILDGLGQGIRERIGSIKEVVTGFADSLPDWVRERLGIQSPSRVFREIGSNIMQGLDIGLMETGKQVGATMRTITSGLSSDIQGLFRGVLVEGKSFKSALGSIFGNISGRIVDNALGGAAKALVGAIPAFAGGTNYAPGGLALVGERGPELVNLPRGSQVIPNDRLGGMSISQHMTFNVQGGGDPRAIAEAVRPMVRQEAVAVFARSRREGR